MKIEAIQECKVSQEPADGLQGFSLRHSQHLEGFKEMLEEKAELCRCGHHLGYYTYFGFSLVSEAPRNRYKTIATIEPGNSASLVCSKCDRSVDVSVPEDYEWTPASVPNLRLVTL